MIYTPEQLNKMDAGSISRCSPQHVQSVIKDLIATAIAVAAQPFEAQPVPHAVLEAAINWWKGLRPVAWSEAEHLVQPAVNASTGRGAKLALAIAAHVAAPTVVVSAAPSGGVEIEP